MKKLNEWLMMSLVALSIGTSACSGGGEDEPAAPEFPTVKTLNMTANSEQSFTFSANMDWKLSSNKSWCTLESSEMKGQNISGKAGSQSVKVKVSDAGQDFDEAKATLTLSMGGKSQAVAEITRAGKAYELKVYDADGKVINTLSITSEATLIVSVEANFEFGVSNIPNWLDVEMTAGENDRKNVTLMVKEDYLKNAITNASLTFADSKGNGPAPFPVSYAGMDPERIIIESMDIESGSFWDWNVSLDGKTFSKKNDMTDETDVIENKMSFNIKALNDGYQPVFIEEKDGEYVFEGVTWMHLGQNGEEATLTIDATDTTRKGVVMVFPTALYNKIKGDLKGNIISEGEIKYEYEQMFFLVSLTQKNTAASSFTVKIKNETEVACNAETDEEILGYLMSEYTVKAEEISTVHVPAKTPLFIIPGLSAEEWNGSSLSSCYIAYLGGEKLDLVKDLKGEAGLLDGDKEYYLQITLPDSFTKTIIIVFKGTDKTNKKVLVIKPE